MADGDLKSREQQCNQQSAEAASTGAGEQPAAPPKRICCACPETRKLRDECIANQGEEHCERFIEAHKQCLRAEGFKI
eukprot:6210927-Pleurochrysis_carterae.AAC.1